MNVIKTGKNEYTKLNCTAYEMTDAFKLNTYVKYLSYISISFPSDLPEMPVSESETPG